MANRRKKYMPSLVRSNQYAFIAGRSTIDNVLVASELVKGYIKVTLSPRCAIKIDLQKAFDSLDWKFIPNVLFALKFPDFFID